MISFEKLTIVVMASNEQDLLRETLKLLSRLCDPKDIEEIIVFLKSEDCPAKSEYDRIVSEGFVPFPMRDYIQTIHGFDQMFYEAPRLVESSHFLLIGADLEMDPHSVPEMIRKSKENPGAIVCASKFAEGSSREKYGFLHMLCVRFVNFVVGKIIHSDATEILATFQIYPTEIHRKMIFVSETRAYYSFTIKPIVYGVDYIEIPTKYVCRDEGISNLGLLHYMKMGFMFIDTAHRHKAEKKREDKLSKKNRIQKQ